MNNSPFIFNPVQPIPSVAYFADLPDPALNYGTLYYVENSSGIWLINRRSYGFYRSNGLEWLLDTEAEASSGGSGSNQVVILYNRSASIDTYVGAAVYLNSFGTLINASMDSSDTSAVIGVVINKPTATTADLLVAGLTPEIYSGLSIGSIYFLDSSAPGGLSTSVPNGAAEAVLNVGIAVSSTELLVNIKNRLIRAL